MSQKINFYQEEFRKSIVVFSSKQMGYVFLFVSILCLLYSTYLFLSLGRLQAQLQDDMRHNEKTSGRIAEIEKALEVPKLDASLDLALKKMLEMNNDKQRLINYISRMNFDNDFTSSAYYEALQNNDQAGVWLTEIVLSENSKNISLKGVGKHASAIPSYIENLKNYSVFKTKSYYSMVMEKQEAGPSYVDFYFTSLKKADEKGI